MYIPAVHRIDDPELVVELMRQYSFATLVSISDGVPVATHLPILVETGEPVVLCGHMARQNKQWKSLTSAEALVIFAGPHGYVSPRFYETRPNVPTWNYVSIHAYGSVELIEDDEAALSHLEKMVDTFDPTLAEVQPESMERGFFRKMLPGIVVFRITVSRIDAKAKLNQNKAEVDRAAVRDRYLDSDLADEQVMGTMMRDIAKQPEDV